MLSPHRFYLIFIFSIYLLLYPAHIFAAPELPKDIEWLTNDTDTVYASPKAKKGGTFRVAETAFPPTFRVVGPDSNSPLRGYILANQLSLIGIHPNTENITPELATHWAFDPDKKTMYFKLNKNARWSDGQPVVATDYAFTLEFMRSKHLKAPWYNDYYTNEIDSVIVYDDHTIAVRATKAQPDLYMRVGISPTPQHYYKKIDENFVKKYNWEIVPNTGPYQISTYQKGKSITFKRKKNWWAKDLKFNKNRYNVDRVKMIIVKDFNMQWEYFKKGKIDTFPINFPNYWHVKSKTPVVENGYVNKIWFFNDSPRSATGLWLNQDIEIFKDINIRYAFAHAMNIQKVIDQVLRKDYFRLEHMFVGYGKYSNNSIKARRYSIEKVAFYMKKAGWNRGPDGIWQKDNLRFSVQVLYTSEEHTPRLVVIKEEAKKAGIELRLSRLDMSAWYKKIVEKKHDVSWSGWGTSLRPSFWQFFHSINAHKPQTNNITNTDNPEMDKLIDAYRNSLKEEERVELALKIQAKIHELGAFVPTFMVPYTREAYWRWWQLPTPPGTKLSGSLFSPFDSSTGGLFWYDKAIHKQTKKAMKKKMPFPPSTIIDKTYKINTGD